MKERREQPNQKTNPTMITSAKNYTKKKTPKRTDRTLGKMLQQSYTDKITQRGIQIDTHKKRKRKKYTYKHIKKGREQPNQ